MDRAAIEEAKRRSPTKQFSGVKSKVAQNMKSQKKAKKTAVQIENNKTLMAEVLKGDTAALHALDVRLMTGNASPLKSSPGKATFTVKTNTVIESPMRAAQIQEKEQELQRMAEELNQMRETRGKGSISEVTTLQGHAVAGLVSIAQFEKT